MLKIDFVSDIACPWCAVGLNALERALENLEGEVSAEIHFQPFELNPNMPPEGQDVIEHLTEKYRITPEQVEANQAAIRQRGAEVGFQFNPAGRRRVQNTFDAHRLLHWAAEGDHQRALKHALLKAYFTDREDPSDRDVLIRIAGECGLDTDEAAAILDSDRYAKDVKASERLYLDLGINSVPAIIINDRHLLQGGQPVEVFERALRQIAADMREGKS